VKRLRGLLVAAAALALAAQTLRATHRVQSSAVVHVVQQQVAAMGGARPPAPMTRAMEAALVRAHELDPAAVEPLAFRADLLLLAGRLRDSAVAYERAAVHEPRAETFFNWGLAYEHGGLLPAAAIQIKRGVALAPSLGGQVPSDVEPSLAATPLLPIPPFAPPGPAAPSDSP
jgi:hypothetical protein